jgi:hypothetical protein
MRLPFEFLSDELCEELWENHFGGISENIGKPKIEKYVRKALTLTLQVLVDGTVISKIRLPGSCCFS